MLLANVSTLGLLKRANDTRYLHHKGRQEALCCRLLCQVKAAHDSHTVIRPHKSRLYHNADCLNLQLLQ